MKCTVQENKKKKKITVVLDSVSILQYFEKHAAETAAVPLIRCKVRTASYSNFLPVPLPTVDNSSF
jgi:hypothetical protein